MFNVDLFEKDKTTDELLEQVRLSAMQSFNNKSPALSVTPFAALLVKLSREANETADKNMIIQKRMIWLTFIILLISVAQLFLIVFPQTSIKTQSVISTPATNNSGTASENNNNPINVNVLADPLKK